MFKLIKAIKTQLGLDRYASERDLLQMELWAIHPHRKRLDRLHRQEIQLDVYLKWPITEAELKRRVDAAELPQTL